MKNKTYAVIDMGTNTFHLLVAVYDGEGVKILHKEKKSVKIGQGGISQGFIAKEAIDRAVDTLKYFYQKAIVYAPTFFVTATSAVRNASNKDELLNKIKLETGISVQVISGEFEAELIYEGVKQSMNLGQENSLIMDIGGGSVEFILCNEHQIFWKGSFEIGGQRLIDLFHHQEPMTAHEIKNEKDYLEKKLQALLAACDRHPPATLVGASGSFDTLATMDIIQKKINVNIEDEKEYQLDMCDFYSIYNQVKPLNKSERLALPGMLELRAEMIVVSCVLIDFVLEKIKFSAIKISTYALKEGVLSRLISGEALS